MTGDLFFYSAFGLSIASELLLPELQAGEGAPDVFIRRGRVPSITPKASRREQVIFGTQSGTFRIRDGREIIVDPLRDADVGTVRLVLLGRVMACLLGQRGWFPLHASGVAIGGEAALFVGSSGSGKSTMAAAMHARGHAVITDDVGSVKLAANVCEVLPSMPRLRLSPDSAGIIDDLGVPEVFSDRAFHVDKYNINLAQPGFSAPLRLKRIYFLDFASEFCLTPVSPLTAVASLGVHAFGSRQGMEKELAEVRLRNCAALERLQLVRRLARPRDFEFLPEIARSIEEDMASRE